MKIYKCKKCGFVGNQKFVCFRCRTNAPELLGDTKNFEKYERLLELLRYKYDDFSIKLLVKLATLTLACSDNCPATESCKKNIPVGTKDVAIKYCSNRVTDWLRCKDVE